MTKMYLKKAGAPTVVVTLIFFLNYYFFGMENTIIGPFLTLSFLKFKDMGDYRGCMLKSFVIYSVMAVFAWLALLHPAMNVLINGIALFWIGYFLIDEYNPLNYFPAGMALVFFQISPVSGMGILIRILALTVSFFIVFLTLEIIRWFRRNEKPFIEMLVEQGLDVSGQMIINLEKKDRENTGRLQNELCRINRSISRFIYESNRSAIGKKVKANCYTCYIACFHMLNSLSNQILECNVGEGTVQIEQMRLIVREFEKKGKKEITGNPFEKYHFRENPLDIRSFRLRFALRLLCVMTPCITYGYLCPWPNGYWLAISVFFMMIPVYENTLNRVVQRIKGSVFGVLICLTAFYFLRGFWARVAFMTLANFFIYCSGSYTSMVTGITCSALALNFATDSHIMMLGQRLLYTFAGAAIAIAANLWIFRIRAWKQCQYIMGLLDEITVKMKEASSLPKKTRQCVMGQHMLKSYLLSSQMEDFNNMASEENKRQDIKKFVKEHMLFTSRLMLSQYIIDS